MKNLILLLFLFVSISKSQQDNISNFDKKDRRISTINELKELGYDIGSPVFKGDIGGKKIYTVSYSTNSRCKGKKIWCRQCPGCCSSGYADYEEDLTTGGNIRNVMVGGVNGDLYKFPNENSDVIIPRNSSCE